MGINEILTIIGFGLVYIAALITSIINIRIKLKEMEVKFDMKIINIEKDLNETKIRVDKELKNLENKNSEEHKFIMEKIDIILEKITEIRIHQAEKDNEH